MSVNSKQTAELQGVSSSDRQYALFDGKINKINHTNSQQYLNVKSSDDEEVPRKARGSVQDSKENATNTDNIDTEPGVDYGFMVNQYHDQVSGFQI